MEYMGILLQNVVNVPTIMIDTSKMFSIVGSPYLWILGSFVFFGRGGVLQIVTIRTNGLPQWDPLTYEILHFLCGN